MIGKIYFMEEYFTNEYLWIFFDRHKVLTIDEKKIWFPELEEDQKSYIIVYFRFSRFPAVSKFERKNVSSSRLCETLTTVCTSFMASVILPS